MDCNTPLPTTLDEFVEDLQTQLYLNGLQMAAALGAQLQAELANGPDENSLKKWYTWTRGLNQLQTFRYTPARQATKEQKQRGRPPQEAKIHLNGPAPQLRAKPGTRGPSQEDQSNQTAPHNGAQSFEDSQHPQASKSLKTSEATRSAQTGSRSHHHATAQPKPEKTDKSDPKAASPTAPVKFDRINTNSGNAQNCRINLTKPETFDQLNASAAAFQSAPAQ